MKVMVDPLKLSKVTEKIVCKGFEKKYYRFRAARFYGGIATADCVGCNLRCAYCWAWNVVHNPKNYGKFYSPEEVAERLVKIAKRKGYDKLRISGNEPTICKEHLLKLLEAIPKKYLFILETNGIILGYDEGFVKLLSEFPNLYVRISLKGANPETFSKVTGAKDGFWLQLKAIKNCMKYGIKCRPAIQEFIYNRDPDFLKEKLGEIGVYDLEFEYLIPYPFVKKNMKMRSLSGWV